MEAVKVCLIKDNIFLPTVDSVIITTNEYKQHSGVINLLKSTFKKCTFRDVSIITQSVDKTDVNRLVETST